MTRSSHSDFSRDFGWKTNIDDAIELVCNLPAEFRGGDKSPRALVRDSGVDVRALSTDTVAAVLKSKPELVSEWLRWSEDKRSSPGYYFLDEGLHHIVGYYPGDERVEFDDPVAACADFVIKEIKSLL